MDAKGAYRNCCLNEKKTQLRLELCFYHNRPLVYERLWIGSLRLIWIGSF